MINGAAMDHSEHAAHDATYSFPLDQRSRVRFTNESYRLHPMHLHGMFFRVIARNGAAVDEPFTRDTVLVHPQETLDVSVVPRDAGMWMAHCHVLEHAEAGMMTLIDVREGRAVMYQSAVQTVADRPTGRIPTCVVRHQ